MSAPVKPQSTTDIQKERTAEWLAIFRHLLAEINKHPGVDLAYKKPSDAEMALLSEAEVAEILVLTDRSTKERKGYFEAMSPIKDLTLRGRIKRTDPRVWKLTFALGKGEFRPRYGAVEVMVHDLFDIPETEADAKAQEVIDSRSALPPVPIDRKETPPWLGEFAEAVGDCEYASAFLIPLLNMSDERARSAIAAIAEGRRKAKEARPSTGQDARRARRDYVDACLRAVKAHQRTRV
jgi:hypothetical protein